MKILDFFKNPQKKIFLVSFCVLLLSILAQFITSCVWISRLLPFFVRAEKSAKNVYNFIIWTLIFSIFDFIYIVVLLVFYIFFRKQCKSCIDSSWKIIGNFIMMLCLLLIGIIIGFVAASYSLKGKHSLKNKCYKYVYDGFISVSQYIYVEQDKFNKWITNYVDRANNDLKYFCESVGIPTFLWSFFQAISIVSIIVGFIISSKNPENEISENEDIENHDSEKDSKPVVNDRESNENSDSIIYIPGVVEDVE